MPRSAQSGNRATSNNRWIVGLLAVLALLVSGVGIATASMAQAATTQNLVRDPSFRYGTSAWTVTKGTKVWVTSYGHAGHRSIGIRNLASYPRTITLNAVERQRREESENGRHARAAGTQPQAAWRRTGRYRAVADRRRPDAGPQTLKRTRCRRCPYARLRRLR